MMFFVVIVSVVCGGVTGCTLGFVIGHIRCSGKIVKMLETVTLAIKRREADMPIKIASNCTMPEHHCARCQKSLFQSEAYFNPSIGIMCGECNAKSLLNSDSPFKPIP